MSGKTYQAFLNFRNKELARIGGKGVQGYHVFDNATAKAIYDLKPTTLQQLSKVKGFPLGGQRIDKYGDHIIRWFMGSSVFTK